VLHVVDGYSLMLAGREFTTVMAQTAVDVLRRAAALAHTGFGRRMQPQVARFLSVFQLGLFAVSILVTFAHRLSRRPMVTSHPQSRAVSAREVGLKVPCSGMA